MKIWVYIIDWRSLAIDVIAECKSEHDAELAHKRYRESLTDDQLIDVTQFKTIAATPVSPEMEAAVQQFKRLNGRTVA